MSKGRQKRIEELEAENERLKLECDPGADYWVRKGMERAAEIANTQCTETNECPVWKQIRAELEKSDG